MKSLDTKLLEIILQDLVINYLVLDLLKKQSSNLKILNSNLMMI
jgi:hypothetical protein